MARTKAGLGPGARLADYLGASLMARVVPPEIVHEVLNAHGRISQRIRAFPAVAGVYYVMALRQEQPLSGAFPPEQPRKRAAWFARLLERCARLQASRTINRRSPRMVKRRNSRYAPHKPDVPTRVPMDSTPRSLRPMADEPRAKPARRSMQAWSASNPKGSFHLRRNSIATSGHVTVAIRRRHPGTAQSAHTHVDVEKPPTALRSRTRGPDVAGSGAPAATPVATWRSG